MLTTHDPTVQDDSYQLPAAISSEAIANSIIAAASPEAHELSGLDTAWISCTAFENLEVAAQQIQAHYRTELDQAIDITTIQKAVHGFMTREIESISADIIYLLLNREGGAYNRDWLIDELGKAAEA